MRARSPDPRLPAAAPAAPSPAGTSQQQQRQRRARGLACRAAVTVHEGKLAAGSDMRFGVVVGRFNDLVTKLLLDGCLHSFAHRGVADSNVDVSACLPRAADWSGPPVPSCWLRQAACTPDSAAASERRSPPLPPPDTPRRWRGCPAPLSCRWWLRPWPRAASTTRWSA